jgi:hypothetical protein
MWFKEIQRILSEKDFMSGQLLLPIDRKCKLYNVFLNKAFDRR